MESFNGALVPLILVFYLAAPLYPIPFIGLSLSLPLILLLALKNGKIQIPRKSPLVFFIPSLILALTISFFINIFSGELNEGIDGSVKYIAQFGFYFIAAALGYKLFLYKDFPPKASIAFALAIFFMSAFILFENLVLGGVSRNGGWSQLTRMSQNSYAVQFSNYLPFVFYAVAAAKQKTTRQWWILLAGFCLTAVVANGSRTAWITTLLTLTIFFGLHAYALRKYKAVIFAAVITPLIILASISVIPDSLRASLERDFNTFGNLEADKSWMIRQLQIQKAEKIFEDNPWFGVGPAQFKNQAIGLEMPEVLAGRNEYQFSDISAHNSYIQFLSEGGLVFMVPFTLMLAWLLIKGAGSSIILARSGEVWAISLFSGFIGLSIHFWTISGLTTTGPWFFYGAMAAMITRARFVSRQQNISRSTTLNWKP